MQPEGYRDWRHKEREQDERMAIDPRFRWRETVKQIVGDAMLVGAIVMFAWASMPG